MADFEVEGLREVQANLHPNRLRAPKRRFLTRTGIGVQGKARVYAPVDRGILRNSIGYQLKGDDEVAIGSNLPYAPMMEFGTGRLSDAPRHSPGHSPAGHQLETWARRHGFESGFQVARIIRKRGGLKPRRYLRRGLEDHKRQSLGRDVAKLGDEIQAALGGG